MRMLFSILIAGLLFIQSPALELNPAIQPILPEEFSKIRPGFTDAERLFLAQNPTIRVGIDPNRVPFGFLSQDGQFKGLSSDILGLISSVTNLKLIPVVSKSWQEANERLMRGELHFLEGLMYTPQRARDHLLTRPYFQSPVVLFSNKLNTPYLNMMDLNSKKVSVVQGYGSNDLMKLDWPKIQQVVFDNTLMALRAVAQAEVVAHPASLTLGNFLIAEHNLFNLHVAGETPYSIDLCMGVSKHYPLLHGIVQKTLDTLNDQYKEKLRQKWLHPGALTQTATEESNKKSPVFLLLGVSIIILLIYQFITIQKLKSQKTQ